MDEQVTTPRLSRRAKSYRVEIHARHNLLICGKLKPKRLLMHRYPFTPVRIVLYDENGQQALLHLP